MMSFEYLLLILLSLLPLAYKFSFWAEIFSGNESIGYKLKKGFSHFWSYIEFPLLFFSVTIFIEPLFEIFLYNFFFYFLVLYNIFVWGKIFRKKLPHMHYRGLLFIFTIGVFLVLVGIVLYIPNLLYTVIIGIFSIIPLLFVIKGFLFSKKSLE
ncbi:hypothetical protein LAT59_01015 [Candidatus Gracilibacteria bacterium]|nr:hypothetical protein [Candidatus Gracilibacteria bacterium]